jgi:hypothetical protein
LRAAGDVQGLSLPESVMSPMLEINECGGTAQRRLRGPNVVLVFAKKGIPEGIEGSTLHSSWLAVRSR